MLPAESDPLGAAVVAGVGGTTADLPGLPRVAPKAVALPEDGIRAAPAVNGRGGDTLPALEAIRPGDVIAGKYRVERTIGAGGMGVVLAAEHLELHERVALKLMRPEATESEEAMVRFRREARAAAKIKGEHVARVLDVGRLDGGVPFIVMEYLEGEDLGEVVTRQGALSVEDASAYVLQACEAIAEAHALGIVHRDLKPSNLFLARRLDGSPLLKVLDFGVSKLLPRAEAAQEEPGERDLVRTRTAQMLGSPCYMSPEQMISARNAGPAADIWALGVVLFELVTGSRPFDASSLQELRWQIVHAPAPPLRRYLPSASPKLEAIVLRCLEKRPEQRYPDVAAFAEALGELASRNAQRSIERVRGILRKGAEGQSGAESPPLPARAPEDGHAARRWALSGKAMTPVAGALAAFALVIASALWALRGAGSPTSGAAPDEGGAEPPSLAQPQALTPGPAKASAEDIGQATAGATTAPPIAIPPAPATMPATAPSAAPAAPPEGKAPARRSGVTRGGPPIPARSANAPHPPVPAAATASPAPTPSSPPTGAAPFPFTDPPIK
ncbi:serine/threonine-protein kinase [Sorangium sp. So ce134]